MFSCLIYHYATFNRYQGISYSAPYCEGDNPPGWRSLLPCIRVTASWGGGDYVVMRSPEPNFTLSLASLQMVSSDVQQDWPIL